jgi:hypothetical protein
VDEKTWDEMSDTGVMLTWLRGSWKTSARKLRLFACAAVRRVWGCLTDPGSRNTVEVAERFADGLATACQMQEAVRQATRATAVTPASMAAYFAAAGDYLGCVACVTETATYPGPAYAAQGGLLRDVFGNPFRGLPAVAPSVLRWQDGLVVRLARAAYDERVLPEGLLDSARLAVLADALEEAGCDASLLGHLRSPGPHTRGCHVVDLVLGRL